MVQCWNPCVALVVQPPNWHVPCAPCLAQRLRALARVVQPFIVHTFVLPPLCLPHPPCSNSRGAAEVRAEPVCAMFPAESTSKSSCITPFSRAGLLSIMRPANASCMCIVAAAVSGALHFGGMMETNTAFSCLACVSDARIHCADPKCAMLCADKCPQGVRSVAAWSSAG